MDGMPLGPALRHLLHAFRDAVRNALGDHLVALYISGSLLMGDFEPASSDIDFLGVTALSPNGEEIERLRIAHAALARTSAWGDRLEGGYAARSALRPWGIEGSIVAVAPGKGVEGLVPSDYSADNMVAIREGSLALHGPEAAAVLPTVDRETLLAGLGEYLAELVARRADAATSADELASWSLNIARCLFGMEAGRPCTKREAATWLAERVPDLAPALALARAARRGDAGAEARQALRSGLALLQAYAAARMGR